jgi:tetratricopeptide (TPR) repeat protein
LFFTLRYENLKEIFNNKKWNVLSVAFELYDKKNIPDGKESEFYYMWGKTLRVLGAKEQALEPLAKSLSYNDRAPNSALWEYASTLFEIYEGKEIDRDIILKPFRENGYEVTNIEYDLIKNWFDKKHYKQVMVAFELFDISKVEEEKKSEIYYMWGRTLYILEIYDKCIAKFNKTDCLFEKEVLEYIAKSLLQLEKWNDSYKTWTKLLELYPKYKRGEVLNNILFVLKNLDESKAIIENFKNQLIKEKLKTNSINMIELL